MRSSHHRSHPHGHHRVLRPRTGFAVLLLAVFVSVLLVDGYVHNGFAGDHRAHTPVAAGDVPERVVGGGPVIVTDGDQVHSYRSPDRTIALTFDDGPDPTWTPRVLAALDRYAVPGTFFVTGQMTARHPGIVRDMVDAGHEIGVHTFSHPDLVGMPRERTDRELSRTQLALAGAAGVHSSLVRPPYFSTTDALDNRSWPVVRHLGDIGYVTALIDVDTRDWEQPGARAISESVTRDASGDGAVVLLHDAGGDRSQTVEALDILIPELLARGYRFETVTGAVGAESANHQVTGAALVRGKAFVAAVGISQAVVSVLLVLLVAVGALLLARFAMMLVLARRHARERNRPGFSWGPGPPVTEPVSIVVPAYNEGVCIANTVRSLAASRHPVEIVVVDDGSADGTAEIAEGLRLLNVTVVRTPNRGKHSALNTGVARAAHDLVVMVDGDTVFEPATVHRLVQPFADPHVGAVAGNAKVGNRGRVLGRWQHIEYVIGFNLDRRMYDLLGCMPTVPGAVGAFRRTALEDAGMMSGDTLAEDTDITMALHRTGWRIVYEEGARAWTEVPATLVQLWRQRYRWSYGTMQAMWKHRHALVERGHAGRFGRVGLPLVAVFHIAAPLLAPLIDIFTLYGLLFRDPLSTAAAWCALLAVQTLCAAYAFHLDGERLRPLWALPLQQLVYRQLMYLVLLQACLTAVRGSRLPWQKLNRTGDVPLPPPPPPPALAAAPTRAPGG